MNLRTVEEMFDMFKGFVEVRFVRHKGVAFIEFKDEQFAGMALEELNRREAGSIPMRYAYAKK